MYRRMFPIYIWERVVEVVYYVTRMTVVILSSITTLSDIVNNGDR